MPKRKRASRKTIGTKFSDSTTFSDSTSSSSASSSSSKMRKKGTGGIKETSNGRFTATYKKKNVGTFSSYDLADKEMAYYIKTGVLKKRKVIVTKRGTRSNNKTGFICVYKAPSGRYKSKIKIDDKIKYLGSYETCKQAAKAHDKEAIKERRPLSKLNYPKEAPVGYTPIQQALLSRNTIGYRGVRKNGKKFQTQIRVDGKKTCYGTHDTAKEAAIAYDRAVIETNQSRSLLHFPDMWPNPVAEPIRKKRKKKKVVAKKKKVVNKGTSKGVSKGRQSKTDSETSQALQALAALANEKGKGKKKVIRKGSKFPKIKD